ncbi:hypothetical protein ACQKFM_31275 [Paenibacillus xylanexedens]|uniref:hypothetical protein n=1 Tax=Paenibacillus xylanexedens TaxID=528191 RepID=UPI003CFFE640
MENQEPEGVDVEQPAEVPVVEPVPEVVVTPSSEAMVVTLSDDQFMALTKQAHEDHTAMIMMLAFIAGLKLLGLFFEGWRSAK